MEFDSNSSGDKSPDISDETRLEASTRQRTVSPVHDDIIADDLPDELIANQHIIEGPLANASNDSEATLGYGQPTHTRHGHHFILSLCLITFAIIIGLALYILTK